MAEEKFSFEVDEELKAVFTEAAKANDRTAAQLLRDFMREYVGDHQEKLAHEAWIHGEVEKAVRQADDPSVQRIPHEDVQARWNQKRGELLKRAARKDGEAA